MTARLSQEGGENSANHQAGRDVNVYHGLALGDVRTVALDVYKANFLELGETAADIALQRVTTFVDEFLAKLNETNPDALGNTQEPDVRRALYEAEVGYACSGEDELRAILVDLMVARTAQTDRDVKALALNDAVAAAPKLTSGQRAALAVAFYISHTRYTGDPDLDSFYGSVEAALTPFADELPDKHSAYQHLYGIGVATPGVPTAGHEVALRYLEIVPGIFTAGMTAGTLEGIPGAHVFLNDPDVFMPAIRDPDRFQLTPYSADALNELCASDPKYANAAEVLKNVSQIGRLSGEQVKAEFLQRIPALRPLFETWDSSAIRHLQLTASGIAIGYTLWQNATNSDASLDGWL